jgi:hypothetical protein
MTTAFSPLIPSLAWILVEAREKKEQNKKKQENPTRIFLAFL